MTHSKLGKEDLCIYHPLVQTSNLRISCSTHPNNLNMLYSITTNATILEKRCESQTSLAAIKDSNYHQLSLETILPTNIYLSSVGLSDNLNERIRSMSPVRLPDRFKQPCEM